MNADDKYLEIIKQTPGASELGALLDRWSRLSAYSAGLGEPMNRFFPDMLWIAPHGAGKTTLLRLMSEHFSANDAVLSFDGNVKFVEFTLDYCRENEYFNGIRLLLQAVELAAGFRSSYSGIVHIELDQWVGHEKERHFRKFLAFLSDHSDDWLIVISLTGDNRDGLREMEAILCSFLRLETVVIQQLTTDEMLGFIEEKIAPYGMTLSDDARDLLRRSIDKLKSGKYFDGMRTLKHMAKDIVYQCLSESIAVRGEISAEVLSVFSEDSDYINRQLKNNEIRFHMGFSAD